MRTGRIEADITKLNEALQLSYIDDLVECKVTGAEKQEMEDGDLDFHHTEYERLVRSLEKERDRSSLPEESSVRPALNDLLLRIRLPGTNGREAPQL